jgi:alkylation response protein AidB-like acyl-CoA dehydrogenase
LGGYGYITEFEVEKIKRDVKITCIYEGTSEIQQNIISTFRWKTTRKTKGQFYGAIADEMTALNQGVGDAGCAFNGLAANALNQTIDYVHNNRLTRQQAVMFALSDMMTYVEVGAALSRKAVKLDKAGDGEADKVKAMARIFAGEVTHVVGENALKIVSATGSADAEAINRFLENIAYQDMLGSRLHWAVDMDKVADIIFER